MATLALLLAAIALVHAVNMAAYPENFDDEGTYVAQAWALQARGELSHYTYWYDHPPLGWILIAGWTAATGGFDGAQYAVPSGRQLMLLVNVVSAALLYVVARRLGLKPWASLLAVALFAFSPLGLRLHRMVLLDNIATPWMLGALALLLSPRHRLAAAAGAGLMLALAVLTKETMLLALPAFLWLAWQRSHPMTRRYALVLFTGVLVLSIGIYPLMAVLKGELLPGEGHVSLLEAIRWQLFEREGSGSVFDPASHAHSIVVSWLSFDHWLPLLGIVSAIGSLFVRSLRPIGLGLLVLCSALLRTGYLPYVYVIGLLPFCALLFPGLVQHIAERLATATSRRTRLRWPSLPRHAAALAAMILVILPATQFLPIWAAHVRQATSADENARFRGVADWLDAHLRPHDDVLLDNVLWADLVVRRGEAATKHLVWYYKLDLDPEVAAQFPNGWRDFEYVVSSEILRATSYMTPQVDAGLRASREVASFGEGTHRIEIRAIDAAVAPGAPKQVPGPATPASGVLDERGMPDDRTASPQTNAGIGRSADQLRTAVTVNQRQATRRNTNDPVT